jgi:raffinose/stachyose/melibiose transport system substrate-binding protein
VRKDYIFKAISFLVIISLLSSFVACGSSSESGDEKDSGNSKELTFWSWASDSDAIKAVYEDAIKNFNEDNEFGVTIKATYTPGEQYKTKLQTEMASNNAPDIFTMWPAGKMKPYVL